jgi:hypothetical protein
MVEGMRHLRVKRAVVVAVAAAEFRTKRKKLKKKLCFAKRSAHEDYYCYYYCYSVDDDDGYGWLWYLCGLLQFAVAVGHSLHSSARSLSPATSAINSTKLN